MGAAPHLLAAHVAGLIFGLDLSLSGMPDLARSQGFPDVTAAIGAGA